MPDFLIRIVGYALSFALIAWIASLVRKNMKKTKPELLDLTIEQLGVEWAVLQLAYSGPMLFSLVVIFVAFFGFIGLGAAGFLPLEALLPVAIGAFGLMAVAVIFLTLPGMKLAAKAGPKYLEMRSYYGKNQKACLDEAAKDQRVLASQKFQGKAISKLITKVTYSKAMRY